MKTLPTSSSRTFLLLISKLSLFQTTTIFSLKTALAYGANILLVHDLGSCPFPTFAHLPSIYHVRAHNKFLPSIKESAIFNDKAITFLGEYLDTAGKQIVDKYKLDIADYDLALISPEKAEAKVSTPV